MAYLNVRWRLASLFLCVVTVLVYDVVAKEVTPAVPVGQMTIQQVEDALQARNNELRHTCQS